DEMKTKWIAAGALLLAMRTPASAHRLDEYLQATTLSVDHGRVQVQMRLTPGVAVFSRVFATIDADRNGVLSQAEQRAYAERVQHDLAFTMDGNRLQVRLSSWKFAKTAEMKAGRGDIQMEFHAEAPHSNGSHRLVVENHHQNRIAVYLINGLVPRDPSIQVTEQRRNTQQSWYELDYVQAGAPSILPAITKR
ncbi:MAG: hypothetical protein JWN14_4906, partial [Chthonomonadales bacterium]|nr:hypothetical protein [Chthonomonadales bacterium]